MMINLLLLAAAAVCWWAWKTRDAQALRFGDVTAVVAALVALRLFSKHEPLLGLIAAGGAGWWYWFRRNSGAAQGAMSPAEARRLLEVGPDADAQTIRAAHRRLITRVHPDTGGSAHLTAQVNAARDTLLGRKG